MLLVFSFFSVSRTSLGDHVTSGYVWSLKVVHKEGHWVSMGVAGRMMWGRDRGRLPKKRCCLNLALKVQKELFKQKAMGRALKTKRKKGKNYVIIGWVVSSSKWWKQIMYLEK